jgi:hypothetical protein
MNLHVVRGEMDLVPMGSADNNHWKTKKSIAGGHRLCCGHEMAAKLWIGYRPQDSDTVE